ncbi:hypothetical protein [Dysgonomonas sp. 25]|uniref:hypothetical protein n=1 Tax=Dysgonomonas sp. 25 TaxID=2302933 RepID=UPI0013D6C145|nr:hypothetical protein [Dysgonomonas sp. 25]NDV69086.1 hypothetical protein [Dysgonomonas sp. 25]
MKALIPVIIILFFLSSCGGHNTAISDEECAGHIVFLHIGEQDKPIDPFIIATNNDTTYLKYKDYELFSIYALFVNGIGYRPQNIAFIDDSLYMEIKKYLLNYHHSNPDIKSTGNTGSFLIEIDDTSNSLQFEMPSGEPSILCLDSISVIAKNDSILKITERMRYYQELQR